MSGCGSVSSGSVMGFWGHRSARWPTAGTSRRVSSATQAAWAAADRRHLNDFPLDQLDAVVLVKNPGVRHAVIFLAREPPSPDLGLDGHHLRSCPLRAGRQCLEYDTCGDALGPCPRSRLAGHSAWWRPSAFGTTFPLLAQEVLQISHQLFRVELPAR